MRQRTRIADVRAWLRKHGVDSHNAGMAAFAQDRTEVLLRSAEQQFGRIADEQVYTDLYDATLNAVQFGEVRS